MRRCFVILILLAAGVNAVPARLLVHLPFDRDGADVSGAGHNAVANNGAAIDRASSLIGGGAAVFDGKGAFYNIPIFTPVTGNGARSVSCWVRGAGASGTVPNDIFVGWGDIGSAPRVRFDVGLEQTNDARLRVEFNSDAVVSTASTVNFLDGEWHHVLVAYESNAMSFFVDGKIYGNALARTLPLETATCVAGTVIGAGVREATGRSGDPKRCFNGRIDDAAIWDEKLTATDAAMLHGLGRIGDNDVSCLAKAGELSRARIGATARIAGHTWKKVGGLPGSMGDWVQAGGRNGAGSFIVLNATGEGLRISPQWWENMAVRLAGLGLVFLMAASLSVWIYYRMTLLVRLRRLESAQKAETERRRISQDLHDDLGARLTEIILLGEKAREGNVAAAELQPHIGNMTDKAQALVTALDEVVWTVNPEHDFLPNLADYLSGYAQEFLRHTALRCRLDVAKDLPSVALAAKTRRNILAAAKEALNNTVRHSGGSEVWLRIQCPSRTLVIAIEDNGRGPGDAGVASRGNGLRNMRERIEAMGGRFELLGPPGKGTTVRFQVPLKETR